MRKNAPQVTLPGSKMSARGLEQRAFQDRSVREPRNADVAGVIEEEFGKYRIFYRGTSREKLDFL